MAPERRFVSSLAMTKVLAVLIALAAVAAGVSVAVAPALHWAAQERPAGRG